MSNRPRRFAVREEDNCLRPGSSPSKARGGDSEESSTARAAAGAAAGGTVTVAPPIAATERSSGAAAGSKGRTAQPLTLALAPQTSEPRRRAGAGPSSIAAGAAAAAAAAPQRLSSAGRAASAMSQTAPPRGAGQQISAFAAMRSNAPLVVSRVKVTPVTLARSQSVKRPAAAAATKKAATTGTTTTSATVTVPGPGGHGAPRTVLVQGFPVIHDDADVEDEETPAQRAGAGGDATSIQAASASGGSGGSTKRRRLDGQHGYRNFGGGGGGGGGGGSGSDAAAADASDFTTGRVGASTSAAFGRDRDDAHDAGAAMSQDSMEMMAPMGEYSPPPAEAPAADAAGGASEQPPYGTSAAAAVGIDFHGVVVVDETAQDDDQTWRPTDAAPTAWGSAAAAATSDGGRVAGPHQGHRHGDGASHRAPAAAAAIPFNGASAHGAFGEHAAGAAAASALPQRRFCLFVALRGDDRGAQMLPRGTATISVMMHSQLQQAAVTTLASTSTTSTTPTFATSLTRCRRASLVVVAAVAAVAAVAVAAVAAALRMRLGTMEWEPAPDGATLQTGPCSSPLRRTVLTHLSAMTPTWRRRTRRLAMIITTRPHRRVELWSTFNTAVAWMTVDSTTNAQAMLMMRWARHLKAARHLRRWRRPQQLLLLGYPRCHSLPQGLLHCLRRRRGCRRSQLP